MGTAIAAATVTHLPNSTASPGSQGSTDGNGQACVAPEHRQQSCADLATLCPAPLVSPGEDGRCAAATAATAATKSSRRWADDFLQRVRRLQRVGPPRRSLPILFTHIPKCAVREHMHMHIPRCAV